MQVPTSTSKLQGLKKAIEANNIPMVRQWVKLGAPLPDDVSLIDYALRVGSDATLNELCSLGALKSHNAQDVLRSAVSQGNVAFAKRVLDEHAKSMLLLSVVKNMIEATDTAKQGTPQMQVLGHILANYKVVGTQSMVEKAVARGCLEAATLLVQAGARLSEWIMHEVKHPGMIGPLVRMGGDLECSLAEKGAPVFAYAELSAHAVALVGEALDAGANVFGTNEAGHSVLNRLLRRHYKDIGSGATLEFKGAEADRAIVARLLDMGVDDGSKDIIGTGSRLKLAIVFGAKKALREEVEKRGMTTVSSRHDQSALTLLQAAAVANSANAVYELHALGADVNEVRSAPKESALAFAVLHNSAAAVAALLECGADLTAKIDISGRRPVSLLAYASEQKFDLVAKMLRSANAGLEVRQALDSGYSGEDGSAGQPTKSKSLEAL
jgi:hypothetical protein